MSDFKEEIGEISADLLKYVLKKRWYGGKSGKNERLEVLDAIRVGNFVIVISEISSDMQNSLYYTPLYLSGDEFPEKISSIYCCGEQFNVYDAFYFKEFAKFMLDNMQSDRSYGGHGSTVEFVKTKLFESTAGKHFGTIQTEQSNSSFILDSTIFKNYRYLQFGENPDITMAMKLRDYGFTNVPPLRGYLRYRSASGTLYLCSAAEYLPGSVDLWSYYGNLFKGNTTDFESRIMRLSAEMGTLTGRMDIALASIPDDDFRPEPMSVDEFYGVISDAMRYLGASLNIMKQRRMKVDPVLEHIDLSSMKRNVRKLLENRTPMKMRVHGDYHLGQILLYGGSYFVIDFEGEPVRSMEERTRKESPLKDVSGILRSLDYLVSGFYHGEWNIMDGITTIFLEKYMEIMKDSTVIPLNAAELSELLRIFLFQKASYELLYEINNRPSWVSIPLESLKKIVAEYGSPGEPES